jgi:hypothetical protein
MMYAQRRSITTIMQVKSDIHSINPAATPAAARTIRYDDGCVGTLTGNGRALAGRRLR